MFNLPEHASRKVRILLVVAALALATAGFAAVQLATSSGGFHGTRYPDTPMAPEFQLTDHNGDPARLSDFRGTPTLLFFGFASCPDVCPLTLAKLSRIVGSEGSPASETSIVLVTVDPLNDTPEKLAKYVSSFGPSVTGLTGTPEAVASVMHDYGVYAEAPDPAMSHGSEMPDLIHTPVVYGIDRTGRIQVLIHPDLREEIVRHDIRKLAELE